MATVDVAIRDDVAVLTLNNPEKLNAINLAMWQQLTAHLKTVSQPSQLRSLLIRGAGHDAFAAGGDLEEFVTARRTLEQARHYHDQVAAALDAIAHCPLPSVAMIRGACIGGGLEIAGACDIRLCSDDSRFGAPINRLGFSMYPGEMAGLLKLAGPAVMKEILLEGRILHAAEACAKGLVSRVVPAERLDDEAFATCRRLAQGAPLVATWHKHWIARLLDGRPLSEAEKDASFAFLDTEDYREGLTAFLEKRKPQFRGR